MLCLSDAATPAQAKAPITRAIDELVKCIDPAQDGKHESTVNGQDTRKAEGRTPTSPAEAFAKPIALMEGPSAIVLTSEASIASHSGQNLSITAQGDLHETAAHTYASVSGQTTSLYTQQGGAKLYAANGPVSVRAHTDALEILADQDVTVVSVNDEIRIQAKECVEIVGGESKVALRGENIDFSCPGKFRGEVKPACVPGRRWCSGHPHGAPRRLHRHAASGPGSHAARRGAEANRGCTGACRTRGRQPA